MPVSAMVAGSQGNVLPSTVTLLASAVAGLDFVNNRTAITGGQDPESDQAFRSRFANYFAARSRATIDAVTYAISQVSADLKLILQENVDASGSVRPGSILVIVDDGTGSISPTLLHSLSLAIDAVRPVGTVFSIQPPQLVLVQINLSIALQDGISKVKCSICRCVGDN